MTDKDALELLNMYTVAAQLAKSKNKHEFNLKIDEATLIELLEKAFPHLKDKATLSDIAKNILETK